MLFLRVRYAQRKRARRAALFRQSLPLTRDTKILDLGGSNGAHIKMCLEGTDIRPENVTIADLRKTVFQAERFGFKPVQVKPGPLPFPDGAFDVVFCSSVIEHIVPYEDIWTEKDEGCWARNAILGQRAFADEICRVGQRYWVQTPARSFVIEPHSCLPFAGWMPRSLQVPLLTFASRCRWSVHAPDFYLLTRGHMEALFPGAAILSERALGMTKSWIALKA